MLTTVLILALGMARQDWYTFEPEAKNFRVELPDKPNNTSSRTINNAAGRSQLTTAQLITSDAVYLIQVTENVGKVDPRTFDDGVRQFTAAKDAMPGAVREITVDGNPGREFDITERLAEGQKRSKMRWVASGNSLFMLTVSGKPGANVPANADRFLGSLEIGGVNVVDRPGVNKTEKVEDAEITVKEADTGEEKSKAASKTPAKATSRKSAAPPKITVSSIPRNAKSYPAEDLQDLSRSFGKDRDGFRDVGPAGSVLVGVQVSYIERFGGPKVRSAQPIFRSGSGPTHYLGKIHGEVVPPVTAFVARPGYAVGGLITHTGLTVDGFCLVFMKVDGDRLDPGDTYKSPWTGDEKGGGPGEVFSRGEVVVGLQGRSGNEVFALGLTALK
jgi:hypothetical protein